MEFYVCFLVKYVLLLSILNEKVVGTVDVLLFFLLCHVFITLDDVLGGLRFVN